MTATLRRRVEQLEWEDALPLTDALGVPPDPAALFREAVGGDPDPWQVGVLRSTAPRVLLNCSRQSGKSTTVGVLALHRALYSPGSLILLLSPGLRQSGELFRKVVGAYKRLAAPPVAVESETALTLTLVNGSRVVSLPGAEGNVRGYSGVSLVVIDEASRVPDDLYRAVRPMLAVSRGRLILLSTPYGKRGFFWKEWSEGGAAWERVRVPATLCSRIPADFLEDERRSLGEEWYDQEYLCEFLDSAQCPMYPPLWLHRAEEFELVRPRPLGAKYMGVDPAEGGDSSSWSVVDNYGLLLQVSLKTPDTTVVTSQTLGFMREWAIPAESVMFDAGGGGKEHADRLRLQGFPVRMVAFGQAVTPELRQSMAPFRERKDSQEDRVAYVNMRAYMYHNLRLLLDPTRPTGFALPRKFAELRRQLSVMPLLYDTEGRIRMLPKNRRGTTSKEPTLSELLGRSPDEADSAILACHAMLHKPARSKAGAAQ